MRDEAIYAKIGIIANGLIGSAVFNGNYMFELNKVKICEWVPFQVIMKSSLADADSAF